MADGASAFDRFPDANPNPVLRVDDDASVAYANPASAPILEAWGVAVGGRLPDAVAAALREVTREGATGRIEVTHENQTFSVLAVPVPDLGACQLYGTDITARKVVERFPLRNPNPVMRVTLDGTLLYANEASRPVVDALGLEVGRALPDGLRAALAARIADPRAEVPEAPGTLGRTYTLAPVAVPEFGFVNLYGTDVTAAREVERLLRENETLLLNILPRSIAARLRDGETVIADRFDDMAVLFADIVGFTELSARLSPGEVVELLNDVFTVCDRLADRYELEKIKTVGDAYMVAGGLHVDGPVRRDGQHAAAVADMGLAMLGEVDRLGAEHGHPLRIRVGMHAGPAVAGVIGIRKFIYDVWGDTVNTASRMESTGVAGRLQTTASTRSLLGEAFTFERRGLVDVKGKGPIETWFVTGRARGGGRRAGPVAARPG